MHMAKKTKRAIGIAITIVIVLGGAWLSLPIALAPLLRSKLQALVGTHLNAELRIGSLRYKFPYGVRAWNVHLVAATDNAELFAADQVDLSLVNLPTHSGPLVIKKIVLQKPIIRMIHNFDGTLGGKNLLRPHPGEQPISSKISDILQLRELSMSDGQMRYEDRSHPNSPPMVWENLNADLHLAPQSVSQY